MSKGKRADIDLPPSNDEPNRKHRSCCEVQLWSFRSLSCRCFCVSGIMRAYSRRSASDKRGEMRFRGSGALAILERPPKQKKKKKKKTEPLARLSLLLNRRLASTSLRRPPTFSCASRRNSASFRSTSFGSAIEEPLLPCRCLLDEETARGRRSDDDDELVVVSRMLDLMLLCLPPRALAGAARSVSVDAIEPHETFP